MEIAYPIRRDSFCRRTPKFPAGDFRTSHVIAGSTRNPRVKRVLRNDLPCDDSVLHRVDSIPLVPLSTCPLVHLSTCPLVHFPPISPLIKNKSQLLLFVLEKVLLLQLDKIFLKE
jgi:hypothetical protein